MVSKNNDIPIFFGLSHMGQVFSRCWSVKIGPCYVFDDNIKNLNSFKKKKIIFEEPELSKLKNQKIKFIKNFNQIINFKYIFFTLDTDLNDKNGKAKLGNIRKNLNKILNLKFYKKTYIIISSQLNPKFANYFKKKSEKNKNINLFYMVDTLKMGESIQKFLNPTQIIIGGDKKEKKNVFKIFKKFNTKKIFVNFDEAIITKMAINIYLSFSVTFANIIDDLTRQFNCDYFNIIRSLRNDVRIGKNSYIKPSLGFSGGHLERDLHYIKDISKNINIRNIIKNIFLFNNNVINKMNFQKLSKKKIKKILIIGKSYKQNSFSIVNSVFNKIDKKFKITFFDNIFFKEMNSKKKLKEMIKKNDLIIYNYIDKNTKKFLFDFAKKLNIEIINIGKNRINSKLYKNVINFF
jgi:nucleotide sugar dehydrogenase